MKKGVDIIVLGATGFTGKCTVKHLANLTKEKYWDVTWGIAGRSKEKLENLVTELNKTGLGIKDLVIIEADATNEESLKRMLQDTKVVINCTGPNVLLSPPIVKACIETGTHYVDISAEMFHILNLYRSYHQTAENANVLVIPACGFSSIPVEAAMIYLERQFKGVLNTVECYTQLLLPSLLPGKVMLHNGTWTSLVYVMETFKEHLVLKRELFPKPIEPEPEEMQKYVMSTRKTCTILAPNGTNLKEMADIIAMSFFHRKDGKSWFPYPGVENDTVEMSQRYLHEKTQKKPVHFKAYTTVQIFYQYIVVPVMFMYYYLSYFKCFRKLLINFPRMMTIGYVSEKGPSEKVRQDMKYYFTLKGKGWELDEDTNSEPKKTLSVKVSGQDPGYDTTAIAIIMCAITILKEGSNMPKGGVIMPGAAFYRTDIVDRLMHDGYTFEVLNK